ncbi:Rieske 2Fe-2S domain-containing protein [Algiphilus sp.]|uniref:Rieske 2Fe-2S domain-containing protein n=1 Tax=Algiphilus sp. TaxID=1872431 RepID=UPI003B51D51D
MAAPHPLTVPTHAATAVPAGWYTVAHGPALPAGGLQPVQVGGIDLVVYRADDGSVHCAHDRCPHLGGRFSCGGSVDGDLLVCPVHGFAFDRDGVCQRTGYGGAAAPKARTRQWPCMECNGWILVWFHPEGAPPAWQPEPVSPADYGPATVWCDAVDASVQTIMEGIADQGHLATVHGYDAVAREAAFDTEGPCLTTAYRFSNGSDGPAWLPSALRRRLASSEQVRFDYRAWGLGYSVTDVEIPRLGLGMRTFVNPTPLGPGRSLLWHSMALRRITQRERIHPLMRLLPTGAVEALMQRVLRRGYLRDIHDDIRLWQTLAPPVEPALAAGDGPIAKHRRWAAQFYAAPVAD